jgi:S1-C subfamily serine protease
MMLRTLVIALALCGVSAAQEIRTTDVVTELGSTYQKASEKAAGSVVAIKVDREPEVERSKGPSLPGLRGRFGMQPPEDVFAKRPVAWCSGVIVESSGTILTTYFNVSGKVKSVKVLLPDGRELDAKILGYHGAYDLAALKVEAEGLPTLKLAPVDHIKAGNSILALGRAPDGKALTVNPGIVSAASRMSGRGLQLDAKLNYGNVGGPVVDLEGRLVAVSCKVDVKSAAFYGQNSGVGFAITHDRFSTILADLKAGKNEMQIKRVLLGIVWNQQSTKEGVEVESVTAGHAAEKAGIKPRDVIVEFDGKKTATFDDLKESIQKKTPGDKVRVKVLRGEEEIEFECTLGWDYES